MSDRVGESFDAVLAAAQGGAGWAAERLWTSLAPAVAGYLRAQGSAEPEDLTSEVFVGVFRSLATFSGSEEQLRSWVFTIAHRRLTDERRRAGRRPPPIGGLEPDDGPPSPSAEHEALLQVSTERVRSLCERLVPDQRDVLLLRLVGGLTVEEVATALDKTEGAVKALQRRALIAARRIVDREGVPL
ncbi:MAG TPA: sigma-70 family RNA polymerase sigma factor [Acidimicrobiales bacterium]|nr:sigma-70 family RNA polymerase sigma factor [Acidimicrobiales bacterium]